MNVILLPLLPPVWHPGQEFPRIVELYVLPLRAVNSEKSSVKTPPEHLFVHLTQMIIPAPSKLPDSSPGQTASISHERDGVHYTRAGDPLQSN